MAVSSKNTQGETRQYKELLEGRFRLTKVVRIDHKDFPTAYECKHQGKYMHLLCNFGPGRR